MNPILAQLLGALGTLAVYLLGVFVIAWDNSNNAQNTGAFSFKIFWNENKDPFLRTLVWGIIIVVIITWIEGAAEIFSYIGFNIDVPIKSGAAALIGAGMYDRIRQKRKSKTDL